MPVWHVPAYTFSSWCINNYVLFTRAVRWGLTRSWSHCFRDLWGHLKVWGKEFVLSLYPKRRQFGNVGRYSGKEWVTVGANEVSTEP